MIYSVVLFNNEEDYIYVLEIDMKEKMRVLFDGKSCLYVGGYLNKSLYVFVLFLFYFCYYEVFCLYFW